MKKVLFLAAVAATVLTSCKSRESSYRAAYEQARAQETTQVVTTTPVYVPETQAPAQTTTTTTTVVPETTTVTVPSTTEVANAEVRTIQGGFSVIKGAPVKTFGVVVGSFSVQANAESLFATLSSQGRTPSVVRTNETINGITGWYRVVAASYDDKAQAVVTRDQLRNTYTGAWLLYNK